MRVHILVVAVACTSFAFSQACGDDIVTPADGSTDGTTGGDTGGGGDTGTTDGGGGGDTGVTDGGGGDTGATDGGGTSTVSYVCDLDGGTVTSCAQCAGFPIDCVYCAAADASVTTGHCVAQGTNCSAGAPNNFDVCPCASDAGDCPMSFQVCRNQSCRTCGEAQNTNGLTCKSGVACNATDGGC